MLSVDAGGSFNLAMAHSDSSKLGGDSIERTVFLLGDDCNALVRSCVE